MSFKTRLYFLREYLFPSGCACCGEALFTGEESFYGLCDDCKPVFLSALKDKRRCKTCGKPLITEKEACLLCREEDSSTRLRYNGYFEKMRKVFPYSGKFKTLLGSYKFKKSIAVGNFFVYCLNHVFENILTESALAESKQRDSFSDIAWVPVPPRPGKIKNSFVFDGNTGPAPR